MSTVKRYLVAASIVAMSVGWFSSAHAASVAVDPGNWTDFRSTAVGGIFANPDWDQLNGGFKIAWNISETGGIYTYEYTITNSSDGDLAKELSHWNLQVTDGAVFSDFANFNLLPEAGNPKTHLPSAGNPGMPGNLFGFKWEYDDVSTVFTTFTTDRAPVWGDFYAKGGNATNTIAYNINFGTMPDNTTNDFTGWIARPDGVLVVPLPAAAWMGMAMLGGLGVVNKLRDKKFS